jgi:hypothetical protein
MAPLNKQDENIYRTEFKPVHPAACHGSGGDHVSRSTPKGLSVQVYAPPEIQRNVRPSGVTMTRFILLTLLGASLAGCITSAEQIAQRNEERCQARGYQPKTDAFADCVTRLETERSVRGEQRRREMLEQSAAPPSNRGY